MESGPLRPSQGRWNDGLRRVSPVPVRPDEGPLPNRERALSSAAGTGLHAPFETSAQFDWRVDEEGSLAALNGVRGGLVGPRITEHRGPIV